MDDWQPTASIETLRERARLLGEVRRFFAERDVLEVETPVLGRGGSTDVHLDSLSLEALTPAGRERLWLQTSPEFHMKRLLAAGSGPIYQLSRVFRDGEAGARHNIEFTMLEWYRPGESMAALIEEVAALIECVMARPVGPVRARRYRRLFIEAFDIDPLLSESPDAAVAACTLEHLRVVAAIHGGMATDDWSRDACCDLLMALVIEPTLGRDSLEVVMDYPASQAALARRRSDPDDGLAVAARFEVYLDGIELANGFDELIDADEQRARFEADVRQRQVLGKAPVAPDSALIAALESGMPASAGVALGVDRLLMLALGQACIEAVMSFDQSRC